MLHMLLGQDDYSLNESLREIKRAIGDQTLLAANTTTLDGQQMTLDQLKSVCETLPFLTEKRLVIVNGLLERFDSKSKSSRQKKTSAVINRQNECQALFPLVKSVPT